MKETTGRDGDRLILLSDFWESFRILEVRHLSAEPLITSRILNAMYAALRAAIPEVEILPIENLRKRAEQEINPDEFVITLDGGIIFPRADARIEITRASESIRGSLEGPYRRVARGMAPLLRQQAMNLSRIYEAHSARPIVLCDDGIGTGNTILYINALLQELDLNVSRIVTVTNPLGVRDIQGIPVTTIHRVAGRFIWLNERDLYWGLPRSGLSVHRTNQFVAIGGVPYTLSNSMIKSRIGLPESGIDAFRQTNLKLNRALWAHLEELHGRTLTLRDCSRLQFFGEQLQQADVPIVRLIELAQNGELLNRLSFNE